MNESTPKKRILIVDDSPSNIKILGNALRETYEIVIATTGERCLALAAAENQPDIVLLDIIMPGMDGYEVCRKLKENEKTQNIPVIFITARNEVEDEMKGLELGAVDYIIKPFSIPVVKARVRTHLMLKHKSDILEKLTNIDSLTNLYNRRKFDEFLAQEWNRSTRAQAVLAMIMIDVDYFKKYNDAYGHTAGDECLMKVAQALKTTSKRATDLVARYGGEEFVVVLPDTNLEAAAKIAEDMRASIEGLKIPHEYSDVSDHVTLSLGVTASLPPYCLKCNDLINSADSALYTAKQGGRNRVEQIILRNPSAPRT